MTNVINIRAAKLEKEKASLAQLALEIQSAVTDRVEVLVNSPDLHEDSADLGELMEAVHDVQDGMARLFESIK